MNAKLRLAALVLLAALAGCADHDASAPNANPDAIAGPDTPPPTPNRSPEAQRLERQAERLALALNDPDFRRYVYAQLSTSRAVEHKLQFQRFLAADGQRAALAMAQAGGGPEAAVMADATAGIRAELYFPVEGQLQRWDGGTEVLVATALRDHDVPVAFDLQGRRRLLDPETPPATPVLALVPQETDFDRPARPEGATCTLDTCGDGGNGSGGAGAGSGGGTGGSGGPAGSPPSQSLYLSRAQFVDTFESWLKGKPEFELHVLGPVTPGDTSTMVSFQCVGEHAPAGYYWDMNETNWTGTAKVFTSAQMDAMAQRFPGQSYMILALEDDDTACEIKTDQDRWGPALAALQEAYKSYTGLKDVKIITVNGTTRIITAAKNGAKLITALANLIKSNDDIIGIAMADSVVGRTSPIGHWAVMEGKSKVNGWLNLEMR